MGLRFSCSQSDIIDDSFFVTDSLFSAATKLVSKCIVSDNEEGVNVIIKYKKFEY